MGFALEADARLSGEIATRPGPHGFDWQPDLLLPPVSGGKSTG
jgi:hypothetical protein